MTVMWCIHTRLDGWAISRRNFLHIWQEEMRGVWTCSGSVPSWTSLLPVWLPQWSGYTAHLGDVPGGTHTITHLTCMYRDHTHNTHHTSHTQHTSHTNYTITHITQVTQITHITLMTHHTSYTYHTHHTSHTNHTHPTYHTRGWSSYTGDVLDCQVQALKSRLAQHHYSHLMWHTHMFAVTIHNHYRELSERPHVEHSIGPPLRRQRSYTGAKWTIALHVLGIAQYGIKGQ